MSYHQDINKLNSERYSVSRDFEYTKKYLNSAMDEFKYVLNQGNTRTQSSEDELTKLTDEAESFLNLVECTKDYYDTKAKFEEIDSEYKRVNRIFELITSIENYIRWVSNANYTDYNEPLEKDFEELITLIK